MKQTVVGTLVLGILCAVSTLASDLTKLPTIATSGKWEVVRDTDPMTDSVSCVGLYAGNPEIQLSSENLYISLRGRGGVAGIVLRYDDEPARDMRLPTDIEKRIDIVDLGGEDFKKLFTSSRLRVRVLTVLSSLVDEDIDLTSLADAHKVLLGPECSGTEPEPEQQAPPDSPPPSRSSGH